MNVDYINVIQLLDNIIDNYYSLMNNASLIGRDDAGALASDLLGLKDLLEDNTISTYIDNITPPSSNNPIDQYSLQADIINLSGIGYSNVEISQNLTTISRQNITPTHVQDWLANYNNSSLAERANTYAISRLGPGTVYDDMYTQLQTIMEQVKMEDSEVFASARTTKSAAQLEVLRELRMLIKQCEDWKSQAVDETASVDAVIANILKVLKEKVPPSVYSDILQAIRENIILAHTLEL
jgi:hypothetical protein